MMAALYPSKKALKESIGKALRYRETSMFGSEYHGDGQYTMVGPSETLRKFYATVTVKNGVISKVS